MLRRAGSRVSSSGRHASSSSVRHHRRHLTVPAATHDFDYIVIGGGSGGIASARRAALHGAKVALVEAGRLGGTCVNVGCVPKKLMFHAAEMRAAVDMLPFYGIVTGSDPADARVDLKALKERRDAYVAKLNGIYARNLQASGVEHFHGWGRWEGDGNVSVSLSGDEPHTVALKAKHVLLAPGGKPWMPPIPGVEHSISSDGFFDLATLPATAVVVGAGYIAVELAGVLQALGTQVDIVVRGESLLRGFEADISAALLEEMRASGVKVHLQATPVAIDAPDAGGLKTVHVKNTATPSSQAIRAETVLMATGRKPLTVDLFANETIRDMLRFREDGTIEVDAQQQTSAPGVYAVGDVASGAALTPVAIAAGRLLSDRLFNGKVDAALDYSHIPTAVFSHPPIGTVGLTEAQASSAHGSERVVIHRSGFRSMFFGMFPDDGPVHKAKSLMKLVCLKQGKDESPGSERVVGVHMIGPASDELVQAVTIAVKMGATKRDFDSAIAVHPTAAEELVTMQPWAPHYGSSERS